MRKLSAAILPLVAIAPFFAVTAVRAQSECALVDPPKGESKFTGQVTGGPTGSLIQVTSESESVLVNYNSSVLVCLGGQPANANALSLHATVVAYGPMKKKGKTMQMTATKILVAGASQSAIQSGAQMYSNNSSVRGSSLAAAQPNSSSGSIAARDDWQNPSGGGTNTQSSGAQVSGNSLAGRDDWQGAGSTQSGPNGQNSGNVQASGSNSGMDSWNAAGQAGKTQNSNDISCNQIQFNVGSHDDATGKAAGRPSFSAIICKIPVDKQALEFLEFAATGRRLANTRLNWQNQIIAELTNPDVSNVLFTWDSGSQVVEVTFSYQRAEITYPPSGTKVTF